MHKRNLQSPFAMIFGGLLMVTGAARADVYTFNDFSDLSQLTTVGSAAATATADGTVMRITPAQSGQSGAFYSTNAITLGSNATFSTTFQFRFTSPGGWDPADGITFVLAATPTGLGGSGVGMGYAGVPKSVAVEFDTYNNTGYSLGNDDGKSSNHVSIDTNGNLINDQITNVYGNPSCGFPNGGTPPQNNYLASGCMSNGQLWSVTISYDGSFLSVSLKDPTQAAKSDAITNYGIDIASLLGTNDAYVGFTSGTGAGWENHDIVSWQFANTTELADPGTPNGVPEPSSLALVALALGGLGAARRRAGR